MTLILPVDVDENENDYDIFEKTQSIFDVSQWLQSFTSSFKSFSQNTSKEFEMQQQKVFLQKKIEIQRLNMDFISDLNKQGLLTKSSIIRILFWYQKILEQMLFLFKRRMNKCVNMTNSNIYFLQTELDSFIMNLNELTNKCQKKIENCIITNTPDDVKPFRPLTEKQKYILIDFLFQSFFNLSKQQINFNCISKKLDLDEKRVVHYLFKKKNEINKYLKNRGNLPKWMINQYAQQLEALKQKYLELKTSAIKEEKNVPDSMINSE